MSEHSEQVAFVEWCEWQHVPVFAIPNGGSRNKLEAVNLKREGVRSGVPDLFIPVARNGYHGLFVEMKCGRNKPTQTQETWMSVLTSMGYQTAVCWSCDAAIKVVNSYLDYTNKTAHAGVYSPVDGKENT